MSQSGYTKKLTIRLSYITDNVYATSTNMVPTVTRAQTMVNCCLGPRYIFLFFPPTNHCFSYFMLDFSCNSFVLRPNSCLGLSYIEKKPIHGISHCLGCRFFFMFSFLYELIYSLFIRFYYRFNTKASPLDCTITITDITSSMGSRCNMSRAPSMYFYN